MIPRVVIVFELEGDPRLRIEAESAEDEATMLRWIEDVDLAKVADAAGERLVALRERRAA